jgi:hypothetical protein
MLVDEPRVLMLDMALMLVGEERLDRMRKLRDGVYEIPHFGASSYMAGYEHYPDGLSVNCYGVCDSVEQLLEKCPELVTDKTRKFVVTVTHLKKSDEPSVGGWRWHKWGPYIGNHVPMCEYLYDEPIIEEILVYHIYETLLK